MIRGLYTAAAGMLAQQAEQDVLANNLANVNTTGFKEDLAVFRGRADRSISRYEQAGTSLDAPQTAAGVGQLGTGVYLDEISTRYGQGQLHQTGESLDLALQGDGFFGVGTAQGIAYTRDGHFTRDARGQVVDASGHPLLSINGAPIVVGDASPLTVSTDGVVKAGNRTLGQIQIARFTDPTSQLRKRGDDLLDPVNGATPANAPGTSVQQGYLEASGVNGVRTMVRMISAMRTYEANSKTLMAEDQMLGHAVNDVGHV